MANNLFLCYKIPKMKSVADPIIPDLKPAYAYIIAPFVSEVGSGVVDPEGLPVFQNDAIYHLFRRLVSREEFGGKLRVWLREETETFFYTRIEFDKIETRQDLDGEIAAAYDRMRLAFDNDAELTLSWADWPWADL